MHCSVFKKSDRKQISGCQGLGERESDCQWYGISFEGDENVLELGSGNGCTTLNIKKTSK